MNRLISVAFIIQLFTDSRGMGPRGISCGEISVHCQSEIYSFDNLKIANCQELTNVDICTLKMKCHKDSDSARDN